MYSICTNWVSIVLRSNGFRWNLFMDGTNDVVCSISSRSEEEVVTQWLFTCTVVIYMKGVKFAYLCIVIISTVIISIDSN